MPILDTTFYNYDTKLKAALRNNSGTINHRLTCKINDTLNYGTSIPNNIYLNSKASFLMHPFSQVSNCDTHFSNTNSNFKYKKPVVCPIDASSSHNTIQIQKEIQNQLHTSSSNYTQVISSLNVVQDINNSASKKPWHNASDRAQAHGEVSTNVVTSNKENKGIDIKHNSYARYLAKKKSGTLKTQTIQPLPISGNKTKYYSLTTQNNNCVSNC
jgi:ribosomal protein L25 (general stress protein Ctc)